MSSSEIPDFCPDFNEGPDLSFLKNVPTKDIMAWLKRNRTEASIFCTLEKRDSGHVTVKTMVTGNKPELEIMIQDIIEQAKPFTQ
jgi:hypothetical protein